MINEDYSSNGKLVHLSDDIMITNTRYQTCQEMF